MSFQPPQQPPSPGWGQQGQGQGLGFGAPQQPAASPRGMSSGKAPKQRNFSPSMIVAGLVMVAVAVGVVVLVGDSGDGGLDAEGAAAGQEVIVDDADFDETGFAGERRCPLGDTEDLAEQVGDTLDLSNDVVDGESVAYVHDDTSGAEAGVVCFQADANPLEVIDYEGITLFSSEVPRGDYGDYLDDLLAESGAEFTLDDPQDHRGGVIYPSCLEPAGGPSSCTADWVHEEAGIVIGLGVVTDDDDPGPAVEALKQLLPSIIEALAGEA